MLDSIIRCFNINAKKGIQQALDTQIIAPNTALEVALFLHHTKGLDRDKIGDYIGRDSEFCKQVLREYADCK